MCTLNVTIIIITLSICHQDYHITGMDVLVEGFLNQILRLKPSEGSDPLVQENQLQIQSCPVRNDNIVRFSLKVVWIERSNHLNMKTLLCILISVMEEGGRECATATKPTLGSDVLKGDFKMYSISYFVYFVSYQL